MAKKTINAESGLTPEQKKMWKINNQIYSIERKKHLESYGGFGMIAKAIICGLISAFVSIWVSVISNGNAVISTAAFIVVYVILHIFIPGNQDDAGASEWGTPGVPY